MWLIILSCFYYFCLFMFSVSGADCPAHLSYAFEKAV
jgi:hypothetical protein